MSGRLNRGTTYVPETQRALTYRGEGRTFDWTYAGDAAGRRAERFGNLTGRFDHLLGNLDRLTDALKDIGEKLKPLANAKQADYALVDHEGGDDATEEEEGD